MPRCTLRSGSKKPQPPAKANLITTFWTRRIFPPTVNNDWEIDDMKQRLEQMQANCAQARAAMQRARDEHFAFGAFNLDDEATLKAVVLAAKAKNAPVLVEVSQGEVDDIGIQTVRDMV